MTNRNPFMSIASFVCIVVAMMGTNMVPSCAFSQTDADDQGLQQLLVKAAQLDNELRQIANVGEQILIQKQIIDCYDLAIVGLKKGNPEFLLGSALEESKDDLITNALRNLQQSSLQKSFELSRMLQTAKRYPETVPVLESVVGSSEALYGKDHVRSLEYNIKLRVAQWLNQAEESQRAKWHGAIEAKARAMQAFRSQDFAGASSAFQQGIDLLEEIGQRESMAYGEALANYAELLSANGKLDEAETLFVKAIEVNDQLFAKNGSVNANMRRSFSELFRRQGQHERALEVLDEADEIYLATGSENSLDRAISLYLKGLNLHFLHKNDLATTTFMDTIGTLKEIGEGNNPLVPALEQAVYQSYQAVTDVTEPPASVATQAVEIAQSMFGDEHSENINWLNVIAKTKKSIGELENSLAIYQQVKLLLERTAEFEKQVSFVNCLSEMAGLEYRLGKMDQAILLAERATELAEAISGTESMFYANRAQNLSTFYAINGDQEKAEAIFKVLLPYLKKVMGESNVEYLRVLNDRAENFARSEQWQAAIQQWIEIKQLQQGNNQVPKGDCVRILESLQMAYEKTGNEEAENGIKEELKSIK
ncbi:tetratricopeptide repeat protein [bacterium]|nr:tetratricopeptide repeat protein [bacterium]